MKVKVLIVGHVEKDGAYLFRKKPASSPPYTETWYGFGAEITGDTSPDELLVMQIYEQTKIRVKVQEHLWWDTEVKPDLDGEVKFFVYLQTLCKYESGEPTPAPGIEKVAWIKQSELAQYDIVPPSVKFLQRLGVR